MCELVMSWGDQRERSRAQNKEYVVDMMVDYRFRGREFKSCGISLCSVVNVQRCVDSGGRGRGSIEKNWGDGR